MELYLNYIYLGQKFYGVSTAAEYYFGKDVRELTLAECASLISITNNPSVYNPYRYPENNAFRATLVLQAMLEQGKISQAEYDEAAAQVKAGLNFTQGQGDQENSTANVLSWYAEQVVRDVIADLTEQYEFTNEVASNMVYSGGLKMYCLHRSGGPGRGGRGLSEPGEPAPGLLPRGADPVCGGSDRPRRKRGGHCWFHGRKKRRTKC